MTLPLTQSYLGKLLLVSLCLAFGALPSRAQNIGYDTGTVEQEIERLQRILQLQKEIETLQGSQQGGQQGGQQGATAQSQQVAPPSPVYYGTAATDHNPFSFTLREPGSDRDRFALKLNLLYGAGLMAPNIGFDIALGRHTTIGVAGGYSMWGNMWDFSDQGPDYDPANTYRRRLDHIAAGVEFRYWLGERFKGHFVGANAIWAQFTVGEAKLLPLFEKMNENEGFLYAGGFTYGYLWSFARRWGVEFTVGAGIAIVEHDQKAIGFADGTFTLGEPERYRKTFVGPTSAGITIVYKL